MCYQSTNEAKKRLIQRIEELHCTAKNCWISVGTFWSSILKAEGKRNRKSIVFVQNYIPHLLFASTPLFIATKNVS